MNVIQTISLDSSESLSRALDRLADSGTAAIITKDGKYYGIVDDRHIKEGIKDPSTVKCETVCIKPPTLTTNSSLLERINAFLAGHFKAIPVLDSKGNAIGLYTRSDLLKELLQLKVIPKDYVRAMMNSPVFTIRNEETVAVAKKLMKENDSNRLVVLRNGRPVGIVSTHDFTVSLVKPQSKRGHELVKEVTNPNAMVVSNFMRDEVPTVPVDAYLEDAMRKMADGNFSSVVVVSDGTAKGVLSATDVFKKVLKLTAHELDISVSGLGEDEQRHLEFIKKSILDTVNKFSKSFDISDLSLHFKKGKSIYAFQLHLKVDNERISVSSEQYTMKESMDSLCKELHSLMTKRKSRFIDRKLGKHMSGD